MRRLLAALTASALVCSGCNSSGAQADDQAVDTTLNDDADGANLAAATDNLEQNLDVDANVATDGGYYPETAASPSDHGADEGVPAEEEESADQPVNEGPSPAVSRTGSLSALFSDDDYPASALSNGEQGAVTAVLAIDTFGRVSDCAISRSSGSAVLDTATCRILLRRARFAPARDQSGNARADQIATTINWHIQ